MSKINKGNYHKASYTDLRTFCKKITGFGPNGKGLCISALDEHYGKSHPVAPATATAKPTATKVVKETIKATPKKITGDYAALEARVKALEDLQNDSFLQAAKQLT